MRLAEPIVIRAFCTPVGQPRTKATARAASDGKIITRVYTPSTRKTAQGKRVSIGICEMKDAVRAAVFDLGFTEQLDGPIRCDFLAIFHRHKSKRYKRREWLSYPHVGRPDLDNIAKGLLDGLTGKEPGHLWANDTQVCIGEWAKIHAARETEQILMRVESIDDDADITPVWAQDILCRRTHPS